MIALVGTIFPRQVDSERLTAYTDVPSRKVTLRPGTVSRSGMAVISVCSPYTFKAQRQARSVQRAGPGRCITRNART